MIQLSAGGKKMDRAKSRRKTPWDGESDVTQTQAFLRQYYQAHYADRHVAVRDSGEADMINSYIPAKCPFCASEKFQEKRAHPKRRSTVYV